MTSQGSNAFHNACTSDLRQVLVHHSTAGIPPTQCLESQSWAFMVLDKQDVDRCLAIRDGGWSEVAAELQRLVESSLSGQRLFGSAYKQLEAERVQSHVLAAHRELLGSAKIDFDTVTTIKERAAERIASIGTLHLLPFRREATGIYKEWNLRKLLQSS